MTRPEPEKLCRHIAEGVGRVSDISLEQQLVNALSVVDSLEKELAEQKRFKKMYDDGYELGKNISAFKEGLVDGGLTSDEAMQVIMEAINGTLKGGICV